MIRTKIKNLTAQIRFHKVLREQWVPSLVGLGILLGVYCATLIVPSGWITYFLTLPACLIILATAFARINDIKPEQRSKRWHVRRLGLVLCGIASVTFMFIPRSHPVPLYPSWKTVFMLWGLALTWLTTPNMPPWWKYITGKDEVKTNV